jgi:hypothetical protein
VTRSTFDGCPSSSWMPTLTFAFDLSLGDEPGHHAIQVVWLDLERFRDLRNRDARLVSNQFECLVGARAAAAAAARAAWPTPGSSRSAGSSSRRRGGS